MKNTNPFSLGARFLSEPDFPYDKKPLEEEAIVPPKPDYPPSPPGPPAPPPTIGDKQGKHTCKTCGKTFKIKEELNRHEETAHQKMI